jgi:glycosyltransferase involved in cell wall biosynthesis
MQTSPQSTVDLSVVVVCYEMAEQIENTLRSLLPPYQRNITNSDYEIILIDNGSRQMLDEQIRTMSSNLRYIYIPPNESKPNPALALNRGVALARAPLLCLMIAGARMLTPGVLSWGIRLLKLSPGAVVEVRGWHLGSKWQPESIMEGYDSEQERQLLERVRWLENGYRLWEIAAATPQTRSGFSAKTSESNCIFMARDLFSEIGGFDERYQSAGGGLVNLDFFSRAVVAADPVFTILGEGTFHQTHCGAATGLAKPALQTALCSWRAESEKLGYATAPNYEFILAGHMPKDFQNWLSRTAEEPLRAQTAQDSTKRCV